MKSKDLRLGNLVNRKYWNPHPIDPSYCNDVVTVCRINESNVNVKLSDGSILKNMDVEAIPISERWLLKFGFELHSKNSFYNYVLPNGWYISMWMEDKPCAGFEEKGICYWGENYTAIRYVHSLQNLYRSLTEQELTIKL